MAADLALTIRQVSLTTLQITLAEIERNDTNYDVRYGLVLDAMAAAHGAGYPTGIAIDPNDPDRPVVYIQLPTGQVSWHMPAHPTPYDGHDTPEKYHRIRAYLESQR